MIATCVYRSGGDFDAEDVRLLCRGFARWLPRATRIVWTDRPERLDDADLPDGTMVQALARDWPGWWSKMAIFGLIGSPVLYCDLDTVITGELEPLAVAVEALAPGRLLMLRNFYDPGWGSGVLGWNGATGSMKWLVDRFAEDVASGNFTRGGGGRSALSTSRRGFRGDQEYIAAVLRDRQEPPVIAQDVCPGIVSYKVDVRTSGYQDGTRMVVFHGEPRPRKLVPLPEWLIRARQQAEQVTA